MASIQILIAPLVVNCAMDKQPGKTEGTPWSRKDGRPPNSWACTGKSKGAADFFPLRDVSAHQGSLIVWILPPLALDGFLKDNTKQMSTYNSHLLA